MPNKNNKHKPLSKLELSIFEKLIVSNKRTKNSLRVLVYLGNYRPRGRIDYGIKLLETLERDGHYIAGIIIEKDDPITIYPEMRIKKIITLPEELCGKISEIKDNIYKNKSFKDKFDIFLKKLEFCNADIGIVFYGYWTPPEIFNIPRLGCLNYHPGPLPFLRGMEPDTFAILEGWKKIWGTLHRVEESFDTGNIICRSKTIHIKAEDTPISILKKLTFAGIDSISKTLTYLQKNEKLPNKVLQGKGSYATLKKAYEKSFINWNKDNSINLERKLIAFCGQDIKIRLKVPFDNKYYIVYDLETHKGNFPGEPGEIIGYYIKRGKFLLQPIVKTLDGVCILMLGKIISGNGFPEDNFFDDLIIPPHKRKQKTKLSQVKTSIEFFSKIL